MTEDTTARAVDMRLHEMLFCGERWQVVSCKCSKCSGMMYSPKDNIGIGYPRFCSSCGRRIELTIVTGCCKDCRYGKEVCCHAYHPEDGAVKYASCFACERWNPHEPIVTDPDGYCHRFERRDQ